VVGIVTRAEVRRHRLLHRAVYVLVLSGAGSLLAHRRADWKDVNPGLWDVAFGGLARPGESDLEAARRELAEEAGIEVRLTWLGHGHYEDATTRVRGNVFLARSDGPFHFLDREVVAAEWVAPADLPGWLRCHQVCPDSLTIALPLLPVPR
jgi:8-oxo-dGTP pyrophosphatase MutT (NUDIX family)